jgi:hypothetical protein
MADASQRREKREPFGSVHEVVVDVHPRDRPKKSFLKRTIKINRRRHAAMRQGHRNHLRELSTGAFEARRVVRRARVRNIERGRLKRLNPFRRKSRELPPL